jgi:K+-transporting ATPase c subunit
MNMKIAEVDDYETDLQKWRSMQESSSMNLGQSSPQYNSRINEDISVDHQKNQRKPPALI